MLFYRVLVSMSCRSRLTRPGWPRKPTRDSDEAADILRLNFGDCITYALAKDLGEALLYKGDDFGHTDLQFAT